jgi:hypothetical protein
MSIQPIPKPTRADRKKANIDTSMLAFPKEHFDRDAKYRAWVRTHRCLLWWDKDNRCEGDVQAAHLDKGGRGIKGADSSCIPLCGLRHHLMLDGHVIDWQVIAYLWQQLWALREQWHKLEAKL